MPAGKLLNGTGSTSEARTALLLLVPVLVFFLVFQYYPIIKSILISFTEYGLLRRETPFIGITHYVRQFRDPLFLSALWNTVVFVFFAVGIGFVSALGLSVLVERTGKWARLYRTIYFIPVVTSLLASTMVWRWLYASNGLLNYLLTVFGLLYALGRSAKSSH